MTSRPTDKCDKWDFSNPPLTGQCQPADAQAALDAIREGRGYYLDPRPGHTTGTDIIAVFRAIGEALENLDVRLKALEGK